VVKTYPRVPVVAGIVNVMFPPNVGGYILRVKPELINDIVDVRKLLRSLL